MKELNIKDSEFGYVHAVSGPGIIFLQKFRGFLLCCFADWGWKDVL